MINRFLNKIRQLIFIIYNVEDIFKYRIRKDFLSNQALLSSQSIVRGDKSAIESAEYIVSLTTYGKRIHDVHIVIESISHQTYKADRVILWLDKNEFVLEELPLLLKQQMERGLEIKFCENYKSYKKLIPALVECPGAHIITIDDDIIYPVDMIEQLVNEHKKFPTCIIGHRAHKMKLNKHGKLQPYLTWELETFDHSPSDAIFLTTGAGTLFPGNCLHGDAVNPDLFLTLCPNADDVWVNILAIANGVKRKRVNDCREFTERFMFIPDSQDIGLSNINVHENQNDQQLKCVVEHYQLTMKF